MKSFTLALFLSALVLHAVAQAPKLKITQLHNDLYVYTTYNDYQGTPYPSNSMYIVTRQGVVLFDTPWDTMQFQPLLDSIYSRHHQKVVLCISTHFHDDRTAGVDYFKQEGIATWSSKQTYDLCAAKGMHQPAQYFTKDTVFAIGNYHFQTFYPGAGHTKDNIVIWVPEEKLLYGGCFIKSTETNSIGNLSDADVQAWIPSLRRLQKKFPGPAFVVPGHLDWTDKNSLQHTLYIVQKYMADQKK